MGIMKNETTTIEGHEVVKKIVKPHGSTGQIYLQISWIGCEVTVIRTSDRCEPCE